MKPPIETRPFFARRLIAARKIKGTTQVELARDSGIAEQTIKTLECGFRHPSWKTVQAVAAALDLPTDYFKENPEEYKEMG